MLADDLLSYHNLIVLVAVLAAVALFIWIVKAVR